MKNYKTTFAGLIAGLPLLADALLKAYETGYFTGKTGLQLVASIGVVIFGIVAKDHDQTGGTVSK